MGIQVKNPFYFVLCTLCVASCLQLLRVTWALPLPMNKTAVNNTDCRCNNTNLTSLVDGSFLHKWLKFNAHHSISHLSRAAGNLTVITNHLQTRDCYSDYSKNFNLTYHQSQPVTHALLRQFYNGFILHRRFIQKRLVVFWIRKDLRRRLNKIMLELDWNIARLYHVLNVSGCDCAPNDCEQTTIAFQQLQQSTKHCFADFNYPINDVAKRILNDAQHLRTIIKELHRQNPQSQSVVDETDVKVESERCFIE